MKNDLNVIEVLDGLVLIRMGQSLTHDPFNPKLRVSVEQGPQMQKPKAVLQLRSRLPETCSGMIERNTRALSGR